MVSPAGPAIIALCALLVAVPVLFAAGPRERGAATPGPASGPRQPKASEARYPLALADDRGDRVLIPRRPERIVSLTQFTDELLFELVEPARILGVTAFAGDPSISNIAAQAKAIPHKLSLNPEVILSLQPDLVFVANWSEADKVRLLRDAGVPVFLIASGVTVEAIQEKIRRVAWIVGEPAQGEALVGRMNARLAEVARRLTSLPVGKRLSVLDYTVWGSTQGKGSSWDEVVRLAGLLNAADSLPVDVWGQVPLSRETLLELDPDILILPGWVYGQPQGAQAFFRQVSSDAVLRRLKAVQAGRVYSMPENLKTTTSQYLAAAVEYLGRAAYPELFR
jgi:iron complex transport system substrate-binding protein